MRKRAPNAGDEDGRNRRPRPGSKTGPEDAAEPPGEPHGQEESGRSPGGLSRRRALKVIAAGAAGAAALPAAGCAPTGRVKEPPAPPGPRPTPMPGEEERVRLSRGNPLAAGTATDPDLLDPEVPWEGLLTEGELATLAVLCDVIIPEDERSPSASAVGAHEFIDEWVSAPYEGNREDLVLIRGGLAWLDVESEDRFGAPFSALTAERKTAICDDICYLEDAAPEHRAGARFFDRVRDLASTAFWTTEEGMADLGFVGNRAMASFEGPPPEVLERLGLR